MKQLVGADLNWQKIVNNLVIGIGVMVPVFYLILTLVAPYRDSGDPAINLYAAFISVLAAIYGLAVYPWFSKKSPGLALHIGFFIAASAIALQTVISQDVSWPHLVIWTVLILAAGLVSWQAVLAMTIATNIFWVLIGVDMMEIKFTTQELLFYVLATQIPILASFLLWMNSHNKFDSESVGALSNNLQRERYKTDFLLKVITDAVIFINPEGNVEYMNPAGSQMTGWLQDDATDLNHHSVIQLLEQGSDPASAVINEKNSLIDFVFKTGKNAQSDQFQLFTRNGRLINVDASVATVESGTTASGVVVVMRDITAQKTQEQERKDFISTASHEMRTPIAQVKGYLELMMNPNIMKLDDKAYEYVQKSHRATEHLGDLFADLLSISRIESGDKDHRKEAIDVLEVLKESVENHQLDAENKNLTLKLKKDSENAVTPTVYIFFNRQRIKECFDNMLSNAIKYTPEGGILVRTNISQNAIQIDFIDSGVGIAQEDLHRLFRKFYRVDSSATRQIGGTGLGLYITKQIIEENGGKIWLESEVSVGSAFHIKLPLLPPERAKAMLNRQKN